MKNLYSGMLNIFPPVFLVWRLLTWGLRDVKSPDNRSSRNLLIVYTLPAISIKYSKLNYRVTSDTWPCVSGTLYKVTCLVYGCQVAFYKKPDKQVHSYRRNESVRQNRFAQAKRICRPANPFCMNWPGKMDLELFSKLSICLTSYLCKTDIGFAWFKNIF